jgi:hypothetical protein
MSVAHGLGEDTGKLLHARFEQGTLRTHAVDSQKLPVHADTCHHQMLSTLMAMTRQHKQSPLSE